jgi:MFS family permease
LLCAVQFLDIADSSIMNVALPSIRRDLDFTVPDLQWVLSGYLITYGGLLLLSGRAGDLLGRRRLLVAGTALGLAIVTGIATARTSSLLAGHASPAVALTGGFQRALLACAIFLIGAAIISLRATNTRGGPPAGDARSAQLVAQPDDQLTVTNRSA